MKYIYRILYVLLICPMFVVSIPWLIIFLTVSPIISLPILGVFAAYNYVVHGKLWERSYTLLESNSCKAYKTAGDFYKDIVYVIWALPIVILEWLEKKGN